MSFSYVKTHFLKLHRSHSTSSCVTWARKPLGLPKSSIYSWYLLISEMQIGYLPILFAWWMSWPLVFCCLSLWSSRLYYAPQMVVHCSIHQELRGTGRCRLVCWNLSALSSFFSYPFSANSFLNNLVCFYTSVFAWAPKSGDFSTRWNWPHWHQ